MWKPFINFVFDWNEIFRDYILFRSCFVGQNHCWPLNLNFGKIIKKPSMSMVIMVKTFNGDGPVASKQLKNHWKHWCSRKETLPSHCIGKIYIVEVCILLQESPYSLNIWLVRPWHFPPVLTCLLVKPGAWITERRQETQRASNYVEVRAPRLDF